MLTCRLGVAAVFFAAGISKLADRERAREDMRALGVAAAGSAVAAWALAASELLLAAALLANMTLIAGAVAALVVLAAGVARTLRSMVRGRDEDCGCFGSLRRTRLGPRTLARDGALIVATTLLLWHAGDPGRSPLGRLADLSAPGMLAALASICLLLAAAAAALHARRAAARRMAQRLLLEMSDGHGMR